MTQPYAQPFPDAPLDRLRPIASRQNSLVKQLRRAFSQAEPSEDGSVAIEGTKLVEEAIRSGLRLRVVFFSQSAQPLANRLLPQLGRTTETLLLPDEIFHSAVPSESPQGVAALIQPLAATLEELFRPGSTLGAASEAKISGTSKETPGAPYLPAVGRCGNRTLGVNPLILGCAGLQDPGNLGTIVRSAEAFGASGVLTTEGTVSAANPKVARASAGSIFRLPLVKAGLDEAIAALGAHGVRIAVTSSHRGRPLEEIDLTGPIALFIGSEGHGVPRPLLDAADEAIVIPHSPKIESLNAAIAASILLYEAHRQRSK